MIRTPPHHQTDPAAAPGQIKTLGDYIAKVEESEKPAFDQDTFNKTVTATLFDINEAIKACLAEFNGIKAELKVVAMSSQVNRDKTKRLGLAMDVLIERLWSMEAPVRNEIKEIYRG